MGPLLFFIFHFEQAGVSFMRPICSFMSFIQSTYSIAYGNVARSQFSSKTFLFIPRRVCQKWKWRRGRKDCVCVCVCWRDRAREQQLLFELVEHGSSCQQTTVKRRSQWGLRSKLTPCQTLVCGTFPSRLQHGCGRPQEQLSLPGKQALVWPGGFLKLKITNCEERRAPLKVD